jgi:P27 family predicted phage terminase small subunit
MGARGPKPGSANITRIFPERPKPPRGLPKPAKAKWRQIIDSLPPDYFKTWELPLLEKYCWAIHIYELAMVEVNKFGLVIPMGEKGYETVNPALTICNKQVQIMSTLATKLRLCPNSRVSKWAASATPERISSRRSGLMFDGRDDQTKSKGNTIWDRDDL